MAVAAIREGALDPSSSAAGVPPPQPLLEPRPLILVTLSPKTGWGKPGSWPQLAREAGLDIVIRRGPEPSHKL